MSYASPRFEEVEAGQELAPVVKTPNEVQVFMFSAITWDTHRTHFDTPYSVDEESLPGVLVHGHLQGAFLTQYATKWAGAVGRLRSIDYQNRGMVIPGERLTVRAKVTGKSERGWRRRGDLGHVAGEGRRATFPRRAPSWSRFRWGRRAASFSVDTAERAVLPSHPEAFFPGGVPWPS